ncbi:MAG: tail fiber domain-containing protein [Terracidiphilus sp.]
MRKIRTVILAACMATLTCITLHAQVDNVLYGPGALGLQNTGSWNSAFGYDALESNSTGYASAAFGYDALQYNTTGRGNSAFGSGALEDNTTGFYNTAIGLWALWSNTTGEANTATGPWALADNTTGNFNTANGIYALELNTTGSGNTATGPWALFENTIGSNNTASGYNTLYNNTTGSQNTASGDWALLNNTSGLYNMADGAWALAPNSTGNYNVAVGYAAGYYNSPGASNNIDIGNWGSSGDNGTVRIGSGGQTSFYVAGVSGVGISGGVPVYINGNGQLGTVNSSIRFKEDVHEMAAASDGLFRLRPVTYRYKQAYADGSKPLDYGLIAEEVAEVYPDLVVRSTDGKIQTVQYQKLTPMLLNEVQKQHKLLEEQGRTIELLEKRLAALETTQSSSALDSELVTR